MGRSRGRPLSRVEPGRRWGDQEQTEPMGRSRGAQQSRARTKMGRSRGRPFKKSRARTKMGRSRGRPLSRVRTKMGRSRGPPFSQDEDGEIKRTAVQEE